MDNFIVFVSDNSASTVESFGMSIVSQFPALQDASFETLPFLTNENTLSEYATFINNKGDHYSNIIVFSSITNPSIRGKFKELIKYKLIDIFDYAVPLIESQGFNYQSLIGAKNLNKRNIRLSAMDFALSFDDGKKSDYNLADIIILGLSRTGKTPTSIWLALHYGLRAANYPITEDDFERNSLPNYILSNLSKCVLLTSTPERLSEVRFERSPKLKYSTLKQCEYEISQLMKLPKIFDIPQINVSNKSVEEIAATALQFTNIHPRGRF